LFEKRGVDCRLPKGEGRVAKTSEIRRSWHGGLYSGDALIF
jgi:hypothetical protein